MLKRIVVLTLVQSLLVLSLYAERFEFVYTTGHEYNVLSTVTQEVFVNDVKSHDVLITNDIFIKEVEAQSDGSGKIESTYITTELATFFTGLTQSFTTEYISTLSRDKFGNYILDENAFMPVVRDMPIFPNKNIEIGDTWQAQGEEFHDFRETFGIEEPFRIPFTATYTYDRVENIEGKTLHVILVSYELTYESPTLVHVNEDAPKLTHVNTSQTLYWDNENGYLDHYTENYEIAIETQFGYEINIIGDTQSQTSNFIEREINLVLSDVLRQIENLGIKNISAHIAPEGITLSLENMQFEAESARLPRSANNQLEQVKLLLENLPRNNLLISGHTALAGSEGGRQELSEQRAQVVADYLAREGIRGQDEMQILGFGASDPLAPNTTEANMAKNRRVEITVLNN